MITPKKQSDISSCSRGCSPCKDNLDYSIALNLDQNQDFYVDLKNFFQENTVHFTEMSFLYYGDFFSDFLQVKQGIENLYFHSILNTSSEVSVWVRAEKSINKEALQYIKNWKERGVFRLKFSISLDIPLVNLKEQLQAFNKTLSVIKKIQLENKGHILLQCNNIEFCKYSLKEKIELFFILKKLQTNSPFLEINFSDFIVKIDLRKNFESDFFSYEQYKECLYRERNIIQYPLDENFKDKNTIYIEHADIFTDAIAIHNPYCKKLKSNNFGSMKDSINQINTKLRAFTEEQQLLSQRYQENTDRISRCDFCIKNASQVKERILSQ